MDYRRVWVAGGTYFFTVNLLERKENDLLVRYIDVLLAAVLQVKLKYPFIIHAQVVLPDHVHCVIDLPEGDSNFALRWRLIKILFSKGLPVDEYHSAVRIHRKERGVWQRRYWEHLIRDQHDFENHINYVHINPVKHGLVNSVSEWPFSTFHRLAKLGIYPQNWAGI